MPDATRNAPIRRPQRQRLSREEKARTTRDSLLNAGCAIVAAEGYAAASIAKIADAAGVAHGTFYNYFEDRQTLFDELLPFEGLRMRGRIEEIAQNAAPGLDRELLRFEAFLNYVIENEGFYRVLYEAEIFAPAAHLAHMNNIVEGYKGTFRRAIANGQMRDVEPFRIECLIYQMLGIRAYSAMQIHLVSDRAEKLKVRDAAIESYRLLIGHGLFDGS